MAKRLYRRTSDRMLGGVCAGLGSYLGIDPTFVRLFFVALALGDGVGVLLYFALWLILPREDQTERLAAEETIRASATEIGERARSLADEIREVARDPHPQTYLAVGAGLIVLGGIFLVRTLNIHWLRWLRFGTVWPALLIVAGIALLLRHVRGK